MISSTYFVKGINFAIFRFAKFVQQRTVYGMSSVLQRKFLKKCRLKKEKFDLILGSLHRILHGTKLHRDCRCTRTQTFLISSKFKTHVKCVLLALLMLSLWSRSKRTCTQARIVATSRHPPCGGDCRATWTSDWISIWGKTNNGNKVR